MSSSHGIVAARPRGVCAAQLWCAPYTRQSNNLIAMVASAGLLLNLVASLGLQIPATWSPIDALQNPDESVDTSLLTLGLFVATFAVFVVSLLTLVTAETQPAHAAEGQSIASARAHRCQRVVASVLPHRARTSSTTSLLEPFACASGAERVHDPLAFAALPTSGSPPSSSPFDSPSSSFTRARPEAERTASLPVRSGVLALAAEHVETLQHLRVDDAGDERAARGASGRS